MGPQKVRHDLENEQARVIPLLVSWEISTFVYLFIYLFFEKLAYCHCCSVAQLYLTLCNPMNCRTPCFPVLHYLPEFAKLMSIGLMMPFNHLILFFPLLLLPSIFPRIRVFSNELAICIRWPRLWSFSFSISPLKNVQSWLPLGLMGLISLLSKRPSRVFPSTTVWKNQFFRAQPSLRYNSHIHTWNEKLI